MNIDTILDKGKFIRTCSNPEQLAFFDENKKIIAYLYSKYRFEWVLGRDGKPLNVQDKDWIIKGRKGQVSEYGINKLGISVEGSKWVQIFLRASKDWATITQNGDGECNLVCLATLENINKLESLLKLTLRRKLQY